MKGSEEELEACDRAAKKRSKESGPSVVFLKEDGGFGWTFSLIPQGAKVIRRYRDGKIWRPTEGAIAPAPPEVPEVPEELLKSFTVTHSCGEERTYEVNCTVKGELLPAEEVQAILTAWAQSRICMTCQAEVAIEVAKADQTAAWHAGLTDKDQAE